MKELEESLVENKNEIINTNNLKIENNILKENDQNEFLQSSLWKTINTGIDIGLRALLPDLLEDQVINLKDNLLNYGFKEGMKKSINDVINFGKSAVGIVTGNFENISQMQDAVKKGGIIDSVDSILNFAINKTVDNGVISYKTANILKSGKNIILDNVEKNIEKEFNNQTKSLENVENYINKWNEAYEKKDFDIMEKYYNNMKNELKNLVPIEKTLLEARKIENMHSLILHPFELDLIEFQLYLLNGYGIFLPLFYVSQFLHLHVLSYKYPWLHRTHSSLH